MALDGTYAGLKASVADWLQRGDLTAAIPDFITMAETQICRRLIMAGGVRRMMARLDASISAEFTAVPSDFMGARSFYLSGTPTGTIVQLQYCEPEEIVQRKSQNYQQTGVPKFFSIVGGEFQLFPAPQSPYPYELTYWQRVPSLATAPNWLFTFHPDAYLYGALLQSAPYLIADARIPVWESALATIISDIVGADQTERSAPFLAMPTVAGGTP